MKKYILLLSALLFVFLTQAQAQDEKLGDVMLKSETPTSFNYQALLYDGGKPVAEKSVKIKIKLQDEIGTVYFEEEHNTNTAKTGMINVSVGKGTPIAGDLNDVAWEKGVFIAAEADSGTGYKSLGPAAKMQAVPYALYARAVPVIRGTKAGKEAGLPIFQVQSSKGMPLFSVYEEGISINVPDQPSDTRRPRGGFAVKSFRLNGDLSDESSSERLQIADGAFDVFVDPVMRGYYGGFAVKTMGHLRDGDNESRTLFNLDNRSTFFTLACGQVESNFQFRDRCNNNQVIMNLGANGKIQSKQIPDKVLQDLPSTASGATLQVKWSWPSKVISEPKLGFTNLMRWRVPTVKAQVVGSGAAPKIEEVDYEIEVVNDPAETKKLTDYLKVGYYIQKDAKKVLGLMLDSKLKLNRDFTFPKGKIVIRSTALNPNLQTEIAFSGQTMLYDDEFEFTAYWFTKTMSNYVEFSENEFFMRVRPTKFTQNAEVKELLTNFPVKVEITNDKYKDCLKATIEDGDIKCRVTDRHAYESALGAFPAAGGEKEIILKLKLSFPNNIYEAVEGNGTVKIGKY
jgi:hypothetical protein